MLRRLIRWLQPTVSLVAVIAICWFLASQWPVLRTYPWHLDWGWLVATCVLTLASWGLEVAIWRHLLASLGGHLPFWAAARIWFLSAIVRYIPGNVWQPLSLTLYSRRHGVTPEAAITSIVLFQVVTLLSITPILVVYFGWLDTKSLAAQWMAYLPPALLWATLIPILAFLLRPQWLVQLLNWGLDRLHRPPLALQLTSGRLLTLLVVALVDWILWGAVFASFTFAVAGNGIGANGLESEFVDKLALAPLLIASFPIASLVGFLSFITPSGFGVREGAFYLLLTPQIAGSVVTVIALGMRVWSVLNELLFALISVPFERRAMAKLAHTSNAYTASDEPRPASDLSLPEPAVRPDLRSEPM